MRSNYKFLDISNLGNDKKRNIFVAISYNGSKYHGWQVQKNAVTVQEVFQSALEKIINETVCIKGCSRTDTGVHANMYVLNFKTNSRINCENLIYALNHFLPNDISVTECKEVSKNFHARYSCKGKEYIYKIWNNRIRNPFLDEMVLHYWYKLDEKILKNFNGIHRNYLMKELAYKTNVRLMTVVIKQSELIINFDKSAKDYDTKNLLKERAGYQNQNYYYSLHLLH